MPPGLGYLGSQFFAYTQGRDLKTVKIGQIANALGLTPAQEKKLLSRLSQRGLIARVRRGLYMVPPQLPLGGRWSPGEYLALTTLLNDQNGQYQISGPNAFYRYGWDEQVPNRLYAYNDMISGDRRIGTAQLTLIRVAKKRLGGTETVRTPEGIDIVYSSKARALMDAVYDWSRFNTLPRAFGWIRQELHKDDTLPSQLTGACLEYGNQSVIRRVGSLLEREGVQEALLRKLEKSLRVSSSTIPWDPTRPKRGTKEQRWGIVLNEQ